MEWNLECIDYIDTPRMDLLATGVCGVLYPPGVLSHKLNTIRNIRLLADRVDDIWLKFIEILNNVPVVCCSDDPDHVLVPGSQEKIALWPQANRVGGINDRHVASILGEFNEYYSKSDSLLARIVSDSNYK